MDANIAAHVEIASFHASNEGDAFIPDYDEADPAFVEAQLAAYRTTEWPDPIEDD